MRVFFLLIVLSALSAVRRRPRMLFFFSLTARSGNR